MASTTARSNPQRLLLHYSWPGCRTLQSGLWESGILPVADICALTPESFGRSTMKPTRPSFRLLPEKCCILAAGLVLAIAGVLRGADSRIGEHSAATPSGQGEHGPPVQDELAKGFVKPPRSAGPWVYWWWLTGNVTEDSIVRDLAAMEEKGIGGVLLFDARGYHEDHTPPPPPRCEFMSEPWCRLVRWALAEAHRRGIAVSINLSSCAGALRGPWPVGEDAPKQLVWAAQELQGPSRFAGTLPKVKGESPHVIAVLAVRLAEPPRRPASSLPSGDGGGVRALHAQGAEPSPPLGVGGPGDTSKEKPASLVPAAEVVDLSKRVDAQNRLVWEVPPGRWRLIHFAWTLMEGRQHDVDILDAQAVRRHFERLGRRLLELAGQDQPGARGPLTHFYSVSWEGAAPTWTRDFEHHFRRLRGYDLLPYLPVLAGMTVTSPEISERFLRDYHRALAECFMEHCYGTLRQLCHTHGLRWHSESGGPWDRKLPGFQHADQLAFLGRNDMPQGEFWHQGRSFNRPVAMAAHLYGLPLAAAEAFTHMRGHWSAWPAALKPDADAAFCDGINHFIWHTFTASPAEFGKPGIEYFAGTHFNPNVTWWGQAGPLVTYLARCQFLLRQGRPVVDVLCYTGEGPYLHWGRGERWGTRPTLSLDRGWSYDLVNSEVLLSRLTARQGRLVLPDGMEYRLLVVDLDEESAAPQALEKIIQLVRAGVPVVLGKRRPQRAWGLADFPRADAHVRRLADELWGPPGAGSPRMLGKGRVYSGVPVEKALAAEGVLPDCSGPWEFVHRRTEDADIYFVRGQGEGECTFRVSGRQPELWDPMSGSIRDALCFAPTEDGRTRVALWLPANGSTFVVFRRAAQASLWKAQAHAADGVIRPGPALEILGRTDRGVRIRWWNLSQEGLHLPEAVRKAVPGGISHPRPLAGPWEVRFSPAWGGPPRVTFDRLVPWNEHPEPGIRYYSGTATYRKTFTLAATQVGQPMRLDLGEVKHIAQVRLNGKPVGILWTDPWHVHITEAVRPGANLLEIDVTNLWVNRLIGDAAVPEAQRLTKTNVRREADVAGRYAHLRGYTAEDPLVRSGLLGPACLVFGRDAEIPLP